MIQMRLALRIPSPPPPPFFAQGARVRHRTTGELGTAGPPVATAAAPRWRFHVIDTDDGRRTSWHVLMCEAA
jgi:hypothetical protein